VGRRYLSFVASLAVALALAAPAAAGLRWRELVRGSADVAQPRSPVAFVASDRRSATARFPWGLPDRALDALERVDFSRNAVVAVFGEFGCRDHRVVVSSLTRRGAALAVTLVTKPLPPGPVECMAIFPTYRLLLVSKKQLSRPYPTRAEVRLARA
jgi:hypothetical protein